jgi:DNA mismatch endonuclease (patch repair protein)
MVDILTREQRSKLMARIRGKDTKPELTVRKLAHGLGYRFRLHRRTLPGCPDIVFPRLRKAVQVHGCFWHRHDCGLACIPKSRVEFWKQKFVDNVRRDRANLRALRKAGWDLLVVWECETEAPQKLVSRLNRFLSKPSR